MQTKQIKYPQTRRDDHVDEYHGIGIPDPYRWLEDLDSEDTRAWVAEQNAVTRPFLDALPRRDEIRERLTNAWNFEKRMLPWKAGEQYFWFANSGLQNQSVLYTGSAPYGDDARVLLDPNGFADDGTIALGYVSVSPNAKYVAYTKCESGSDWQTWHVREIATGRDLNDELKWSKFSSASWNKDETGFYYSRYDEPKQSSNALQDKSEFQKVYFHKLGTSQQADVLVYENPNEPEWACTAEFTEDHQYLILALFSGFNSNRLYFAHANDHSNWTPLFDKDDAHYDFITNVGSEFYILTDKNAPRKRLIKVDINDPARKLQEVIAESEDALQFIICVNHSFVATYLHHAHARVKVFDMTGKLLHDMELPGIGSVGGITGKAAHDSAHFSFVSFDRPTSTYKYDVAQNRVQELFRPEVQLDLANIEVTQTFVTSNDGTQVPLFICHRKGIELNGKNPTYLWGYGGFTISMTPYFSVSNAVWMDMGGIIAIAVLRGGGEYGEEWHQAGTRHNKQNVFNDFIACAEHLIESGYTSCSTLSIGGGSNGGLLVGACMTQRPELFGAAVPEVGVLDMLRFDQFTCGSFWVSEYGSPQNADEFKSLIAYSPLHNVKPGASYPATLIKTADHDDRVVPSHSYKFAAALQAAHRGDTPMLIDIDTKAGHGAGKPTAKIIESMTDTWAFLLHVLGQ
jgi:prolyl oligopeptidase